MSFSYNESRRAVIVERVVKYGQVPRGEGGDKVRLALRDVHEHAVRVRCTHLGHVAPLGDLVGLLAASVGGGVGAALLASVRESSMSTLFLGCSSSDVRSAGGSSAALAPATRS